MEKNKLSKYEAICFILISIITEIILNVSQNFLSTVGTGSIINLIIITIIALIFSIILNKLFKNFLDSDIIEQLKELAEKDDRSFSQFVNLILRDYLKNSQQK